MPETVLYVPGFPGSHLHGADGKKFFLTLSAASPLMHGPDDRADDGVRPGEPIRETLSLPLLDLGKKAA